MQRDWDMIRFGGDSFSHEREPLDAFEPCMLVGEHSRHDGKSSGAFYYYYANIFGIATGWESPFCIYIYNHLTSTEFPLQYFPLILGNVPTNGNAKVENVSDQNEILSLLDFLTIPFLESKLFLETTTEQKC